MNKIILALPLCLAMVTQNSLGFELATHAAMTYYAFQHSNIARNSEMLPEMGMPHLDISMQVYFDGMVGSELRERQNQTTDEQKIIGPNSIFGFHDAFSAQGWMVRGAIREDDAPPPAGDDSPISNEYRVFNHFYDPIYDRPLTVGGLTPCTALGAVWGAVACEKNPDWALGLGSRDKNRFSILDAREAEYRALTGQDSSGNPLQSVGSLQKQSDIRAGYAATMFRALGDVVHLLQDMAQPQHTRNEAHSGVGSNWFQENISGHESLFEKYTDQRAIGGPYKTLNGQTLVQSSPPLIYDGYPIPSFTSYRQFFTTRDQDADVMSRRGMADFSNRSFFSATKNFLNTEYAYPNPDAGSPIYTWQTYSFQAPAPDNTTQKVDLIFGPVTDSLNPDKSILQYPLSSAGMWDEFLQHQNKNGDYILNRPVMEAMADQLIPRAVAYSAGLINYFFRGQLDWDEDPVVPGTYRIWNKSPETMKGTFQLYYDDKDGKRYPVPNSKWDGEIAPNGHMDNITIPALSDDQPRPAIPGEYMLVFNGDMGEEKSGAGSIGAVAALSISAIKFKIVGYRNVDSYFPQTKFFPAVSYHFLFLHMDPAGIDKLYKSIDKGELDPSRFSLQVLNNNTTTCVLAPPDANGRPETLKCWRESDNPAEVLWFAISRTSGPNFICQGDFIEVDTTTAGTSMSNIPVTLFYAGHPLLQFTFVPNPSAGGWAFVPNVGQHVQPPIAVEGGSAFLAGTFSNILNVDVTNAVGVFDGSCP